ncbi:SGNH/GDSL hydrolase family protein [Variovorax sp. dw_954]|uniref:SGNH/GDSL hydrolase family protein n=1 Tax=Variovorax sp. dw_954 TaxID=2720078 RepID=UPI0031F60D53
MNTSISRMSAGAHCAPRAVLVALALCGALAAQLVQAQEAPATATATTAEASARARWQSELSAFAQADREHPPAADGVVFVGSSTIRFWTHLAADFPAQPAILNRGFGGSTMADCSLLARELVVRHKPRQVVVYAGDNDLAEGQSPLQVMTSLARFMAAVRAELPGARISFISVKPSPSRATLLPKMRETNDIVAAYLRTQANSEYIDTFTPMLGADGQPRVELFRADMLHMNDAGYRIWQSVVAPHLLPP